VADGYARNYLLPRKLALPVNESNRRRIAHEHKIAEVREAQEKSDADTQAARLAEIEVVVARRVGEHDALYGSVTSADIAEFLETKQFTVDKRRILLPDPIKQLGEFTVPVKLHRDVNGQVKVKVVALAEQDHK
jgi:large subunit ribosomal protein L9